MSSKRNGYLRTVEIAVVASLLTVVSGLAFAKSDAPTEQSWQGEARDAWIDGKIEASYALNRYLNPFAIDTRVDAGVVRLTGTVESQIDKDLAGEIAMGVDGVTEVRNDLVVEPEARSKSPMTPMKHAAQDFGARVTDATTTARVKFALLASESTDGLDIDVDTKNGTVSLAGSVASKQESELAERIARNTEGVTEVENRLKVSNQS